MALIFNFLRNSFLTLHGGSLGGGYNEAWWHEVKADIAEMLDGRRVDVDGNPIPPATRQDIGNWAESLFGMDAEKFLALFDSKYPSFIPGGAKRAASSSSPASPSPASGGAPGLGLLPSALSLRPPSTGLGRAPFSPGPGRFPSPRGLGVYPPGIATFPSIARPPPPPLMAARPRFGLPPLAPRGRPLAPLARPGFVPAPYSPIRRR